MEYTAHIFLGESSEAYMDLTDCIFLVGSPRMNPESVYFWKNSLHMDPESVQFWVLYEQGQGHFIFVIFRVYTLLTGGFID